jgi:hypothetical protein
MKFSKIKSVSNNQCILIIYFGLNFTEVIKHPNILEKEAYSDDQIKNKSIGKE